MYKFIRVPINVGFHFSSFPDEIYLFSLNCTHIIHHFRWVLRTKYSKKKRKKLITNKTYTGYSFSHCLEKCAITCAHSSTHAHWFQWAKFARPDRFYRPHTTRVKQNVVFKGKRYIFSCLSFPVGHYFSISPSYFSISSPSTDLFFLCHRLYEVMY